jgi:hypothetical protein
MPEKLEDSLLWIVVPTGWSYDDNYYHCTGYELPTSSFTQREVAEEYATQASISDFKKIACEEYLSGYFTPYSNVDIEELRMIHPFFDSNLTISPQDLKSLNDETILKVMEDLDLKFYKVVGVKIFC